MQLTPEEVKRFEDYVIAQSVISDFDAWWRENWPRIGNVEVAGLWAGGRRSRSEVYKADVLREAVEELNIPVLDALLGADDPDSPPAILTNAQLKKLAMDKRWKDKLHDKIKELDPEDEGLLEMAGELNISPLKKKPSEGDYEIVDPRSEHDGS